MMDKPSDILDVASGQTQKELDHLIAVHLARADKSLPLKGACHNCDEKVAQALLFCDEFCRDDFQYREERKKVNGR